jgi:hypothetical protein
MTQPDRSGYVVCDCCGMLAPSKEMLPWRQRVLCRKLAALGPAPEPYEARDEPPASGLYRSYYVTHEYQVCNPCFDYLLDGGVFAGAVRHRGKIALLLLAIVLVILILCLPDVLPVLKSALWLEKAEGN